MRFPILGLLLTCAVSASAQTPTDTTPKPKKPPSKLGKIVKGLAEPAATAAAGAGVQAVLGKNAGGVANALGGVTPCGQGYGVTAGAAIVGAGKAIVKKAVDTTPTPPPCPQAGLVPGMPAGIPGMPAGIPGMPAGMPGMPGMPNAASVAGAMAGGAVSGVVGNAVGSVVGGAAAGGAPGMGGLGAVAGYTPVGLAASAAPGAIKGIKGLMAGKTQDKLAMVRELGKGKLEFKHVNFIEGTLEFEPGFEESFVAFAEAVALVEGTYIMHVSAEQSRQKGADPDTVLARKRVAKVWGLMAASGVSDQKVTAVTELPEAIKAGRKLPKAGDVKIEIIKYDKP